MFCSYFNLKLEMLRSGSCPALYILEHCLQYNAVGYCSLPADHHTFGGFEFLGRSLGTTHYAEGEAKCSRKSCVMWSKVEKMLYWEIEARSKLTDTWRPRGQTRLLRNQPCHSTEGTWGWCMLAALCCLSPAVPPKTCVMWIQGPYMFFWSQHPLATSTH